MPVAEVPNLLYRMQHEAKGKVAQNVLGNEQGQALMALFEELGKLSWESFVSSRLPLLKLPSEILSALRAGKLAYTKAQLIARVKDQQQRQSLLEEAVAADLSLSEIRERVKALQPSTDSESPQATIQTITRHITQSKVWENPQKWKKVEMLLKKLNDLVTEDIVSDKTNS